MRRVAWATVLAPAVCGAAGFSFGENGLKALSMGGAFAGQADDLSAVQLNPAGLSQLRGFHFLVECQLLDDQVTFQRTDASGNPQVAHAVDNEAGVFQLPFFALGYGASLAGRRLTIAASLNGPPAVGRFAYPTPNYQQNADGTYVQDPRKLAPERYGFISSSVIVAYPGLAVSYAPHPRFSLGATLQYVYADIGFSEAVTSALIPPTGNMLTEDPRWDSVVTARFHNGPTFTGVFGATVRPVDSLQLGVSVRPPIVLHGSGTLNIALGEEASKVATVTGKDANLELTEPMEIRVGAHAQLTERIAANADVVYEGWHRLKNIVITPTDITTQTFSGPPTPLAPIVVQKSWRDTYGFRAGASYRFPLGLSLRAGALYEQAAAPDTTQNIDFPHLERVMLTAGAGYEVGPVEILATVVGIPTRTRTVTDSAVAQTNTNSSVSGAVVGDGAYSAGGWIFGLGVRGQLGGSNP